MAQVTPREKAEYKIAEARRNSATELDLSVDGTAHNDQKLTELPESIGELKLLQELNLENNRLSALPEWLSELKQLKKLFISCNQFKKFPVSIDKLKQLRFLRASENRFTELPESLSKLKRLVILIVNDNPLTTLPESIGELKRLEWLGLADNRLKELPRWLGKLEQLKVLDLDRNEFTELPESIIENQQLQTLYLGGNLLTTLPEWISELEDLQDLYLNDNQLTKLSKSIAELNQLNTLDLDDNQLTMIPIELGRSENLKTLLLDGNPLNPELKASYKQGVHAVKAYLREQEKGTSERYESKLLILGNGEEGKTCVSRALRGLPFEAQSTTHGVDVDPWTFAHPDHSGNRNCDITLNIWDFEGQEINHQTHQFFLTTDALYLLVFRCRPKFQLSDAEYWLDTIRSRAPGAQVAIVITGCEERTPNIPQDQLQAEYGDLLRGDQWLFAVGCDGGKGVSELQKELARRAADLEFIGRDWPATYRNAEERIESEAADKTHISRNTLQQYFEQSGIDADGYDEAARSLARLGAITEFPDCPDLHDFIVLQPQWLTKAVSRVMEDGQLADDQGEMTFERMKKIWAEYGQNAMFSVFHNCMKEFELCYDLEDHHHRCLVPLRFGYLRPSIPWIEGENFKTRRVRYRLNIRAPMGMMSRFIVKTHHLIAQAQGENDAPNKLGGVYWHNGVFLQTGQGPLLSQALCEFDAESRTLNIEVRAAFPQKMLDQIDAFAKAVFAFFEGLEPVRSYGCILIEENTENESQCKRFHDERDILYAMECREHVRCSESRHRVDPLQLVTGIGSFAPDIRAIIRKEHELTRREVAKTPAWAEPLIHNVATLLEWADDNESTLHQLLENQQSLAAQTHQQLELKLRQYLGHMSDMLDARQQQAAPALFSIGTQDGSVWNPQTYFQQTYVLTPWCECEDKMHRHVEGQVRFKKDRQWWEKTAPWIVGGTKVLAVGLQLACAGMPMALGTEAYGDVKHEVKLMKALAKTLPLRADTTASIDPDGLLSSSDLTEREYLKDLRGDDRRVEVMRAALIRFLKEIAPDQFSAGRWGELKRIRMPDNSYRWLCERHAREVR